MLAIVEIAGQQFNVEPDAVLTVNKLQGNIGDVVEFSNILAIVDNDTTQIGAPYLNGTITAKIVEQGKGDKVIVFHKKRRKGYRKLRGFRPSYTTISIENISV